MDKIDMSKEAISFRLKKVAQLRKLGLALKKAGETKESFQKETSPQISK